MSVEVNRKNILAIKQHADVTRELLREDQNKVKQLENLILEQKNRLDLLQKQVQILQVKSFSGGATS